MSRYPYDRYTRVDFVPAIANKAAPTATELNGGTRLSQYMPKDGLTTPSNQNMIDSSTIEENFDAERPGSWGGPVQMTLYRDNTADVAWDLIVYGTEGFIVVRRGVLATAAYAASQKVEVYPVQMHEPVMQPSATNENQRFTAMLAVTGQPDPRAVVA